MRLEIIIFGQHSGTYELFLQNADEVQKIFRVIIPYVVYRVWWNRQSVLAGLLFWRRLYHKFYPLNDIVDIREIAFAVPIVEYFYSLAARSLFVNPKYAISGRPAGP